MHQQEVPAAMCFVYACACLFAAPNVPNLVYNLVTTDLLVGPLSQPIIIIYWMSLINEARNFCIGVFVLHAVSSYVPCGMSLLATTSISVDRLLALSLELR